MNGKYLTLFFASAAAIAGISFGGSQIHASPPPQTGWSAYCSVPGCSAHVCGYSRDDAIRKCMRSCPVLAPPIPSPNSCYATNPNQPVANSTPSSNTTVRTVPFGTSEDELTRMRAAVPAEDTRDFVFNPGHAAGDGRATPFGTGDIDLPDGKSVKEIFVWVPDYNAFIDQGYANEFHDKILNFSPMQEISEKRPDGTVHRFYRFFGNNPSKQGHWIRLDVILGPEEPGQ